MAATLSVERLRVSFSHRTGSIEAVDRVSFEVARSECVGIVGESGSGKTQIFMAAMGLLGRNAQVSGSVRFEGNELLAADASTLNRVRGSKLTMIFQDPMTSLTPHLAIGTQLAEVAVAHLGMPWKDARSFAGRMLERVHVPEPQRRLNQYPHELSGGMRQRVMIAMSLLCKPSLVIADEPTTALDVTIQAQILELLRGLVREQGTAMMLITHDLGVVAGLCDRVNVMYSGRIVEQADRRTLFVSPRHPYTTGLLGSIPRLDSAEGAPLQPIPGSPTDTLPWPSACAFAPRCPRKLEVCTTVTPELEPDGPRWLRCHNPVPAEEAAAVGAEGRRE